MRITSLLAYGLFSLSTLAACGGAEPICGYAQKIDVALTQGGSDAYQFIISTPSGTDWRTLRQSDNETIAVPQLEPSIPLLPTRPCFTLISSNSFADDESAFPAGLTIRPFQSKGGTGETIAALIFNFVGDTRCFDLTGSLATVYENACRENSRRIASFAQ